MAKQNFAAWWEKEEPLAPLPDHLTQLLEKDDPKFISQLKKFAYSFVDPYEIDERGRRYYRGYQPKGDFSWIWTLYLHPHPLAKQGFVELLDEYSAQEMREMTGEKNYYAYYYYYRSPYTIRGYDHYTLVNHTTSYYPYLKAIYKLAEKKKDKEAWARLAYRFDAEDRIYVWSYVHSNRTRHYLRRRAWRFLRQLGQQNSPNYVNLATEALLLYDPSNKLYRYTGGGDTSESYLHLWLLNHILYHNSQRFTYGDSSNHWKQISQNKHHDSREEAFAHLWDQNPQALWRLVCEAKMNPIVDFAGHALIQGNLEFVRELTKQQLNNLNSSRMPARRAFAARVHLERMLYGKFNLDRLIGYLTSKHIEKTIEAEKFVQRHLTKISSANLEKLVVRLIDHCKDGEAHHEAAIRLLQNELRPILQQVLNPELIDNLAHSPNVEMQQLAVELLREIDSTSFAFTGHNLLGFLSHKSEALRDAARQLLEERYTELQLDADFLAELVSIPGDDNQVYATQFVANRLLWIVPHLPVFLKLCELKVMDSNVDEQIREYILDDILGSLFFRELKETPLAKILLYLGSSNTKFQEFGARLLELTQPDPHQLSFSQLLELAHSRVARVREEARLMIEKRAIDLSPDWISNLIETEWDDTREWMMHYIQNLSKEQIFPELVYGLLDTARTDIQQLAMELVHQHEANLDMRELLLRASESPYLVVQEYALSIVDRVQWDGELFDQLERFLRTVLFHVAKGSKAKKAVFTFLYQLGEENEELAEKVVPLLADVARSAGKREFERIMLVLARIQTHYPQIQTPLVLS